jgi:hypothetical protein
MPADNHGALIPGYAQWQGIATPAVAPGGTARVYSDGSALWLSVSGGAYVPISAAVADFEYASATTTGTATTLLYTKTLALNAAYTFRVVVVAGEDTGGGVLGHRAKFVREFFAYRQAGGAAFEGNISIPVPDITSSGNFSISIATNINDIEVNVTSTSSNNVKWEAKVDVHPVTLP